MSDEIITTWIQALRSGWYQQGAFGFRTKDGCYCAVGVLVDIYFKRNNLDWVWNRLINGWTLPPEVFTVNTKPIFPAWFHKLFPQFPPHQFLFFKQPLDYSTLIRMNDEGKFTFNQIADIVEAAWITKQ